MLTYVFWFGIINKSSRETHKTTTTEYVMERYRSGHNEAVLKTVCPQGRVGSNPTLKVSRSLIAARGFKSLLLRWIFYPRKLFEKRLDKQERT